MNEEKAREILKDCIKEDGSLFYLEYYLSWKKGSQTITLDCNLNVEELEAIVWWMKNFKDNDQADSSAAAD